MFLNDLPDELNPGRVQLTLADLKQKLVITCDVCGEFRPKRIVARCTHTFCRSCCVTHKSPEGNVEFRCIVCDEKSTGDTIELSVGTLKRVKFTCGCGFAGTLPKIKEHLWTATRGCYRVPEPEARPARSADVDQIALRNKLRTVGMADSLVQHSTKAYFCFQIEKLINDYQRTRADLTSRSITWTTMEHAVDVSCAIKKFKRKGNSYLGVYVQTANDQPYSSGLVARQEDHWPMNKKLTFELYNFEGQCIASKSMMAIETAGQAQDEILANMTGPKSYLGLPKFFKLDDLVEADADILSRGRICLSIELQDSEA